MSDNPYESPQTKLSRSEATVQANGRSYFRALRILLFLDACLFCIPLALWRFGVGNSERIGLPEEMTMMRVLLELAMFFIFSVAICILLAIPIGLMSAKRERRRDP